MTHRLALNVNHSNCYTVQREKNGEAYQMIFIILLIIIRHTRDGLANSYPSEEIFG